MDGNIDKVREALEIADAFCGRHTADECPDTIAIPIKDALAALSAIDTEAIRREARAEALREVGEMLEAAKDILELYDDDIGMEAFPCATQVKIKSTTLGVLRNFRAAIANAEKDKPEC